MPIFGKQPMQSESFDATQLMNGLIQAKSNITTAQINAYEGVQQAKTEMDTLRATTASILSQYKTDESGKPSDAAPKYVHDLYKAVGKEGGLNGLSRSTLISALKGYESGVAVEDHKIKVQTAQQSITMNDLAIAEAKRKDDEAKRIAEAHRIAWETAGNNGEVTPAPSDRPTIPTPSVSSQPPSGIPRSAVTWNGVPNAEPTPSAVPPAGLPAPSQVVAPPTSQRVPELPQTGSKTLEDKKSPTYERDKLESKINYERSQEVLDSLKFRLKNLEQDLKIAQSPNLISKSPYYVIKGAYPSGELTESAFETRPKSLDRIESDKKLEPKIMSEIESVKNDIKRIEQVRKEYETKNSAFEEPKDNKPTGATPVPKAQPEKVLTDEELMAKAKALGTTTEKLKDNNASAKLATLKGKERQKFIKENLDERKYINPDGWTKAELEYTVAKVSREAKLARKAGELIKNGEFAEGGEKFTKEDLADAELLSLTDWKKFWSKHAVKPNGLPYNEFLDSEWKPRDYWVDKWVQSFDDRTKELQSALSEKNAGTNTGAREGQPKFNTTYFRKGSSTPIMQNGVVIQNIGQFDTESETSASPSPAIPKPVSQPATPVPASIAPNATSVPVTKSESRVPQTYSAPVNPAIIDTPIGSTSSLPVTNVPEQKSDDEKISEEYGIITSRLKNLGSIPLNWSEDTYRQMRGYPPKIQISKQNGVTLVGVGGHWQIMKGESLSPSEQSAMEKHLVWKDAIRTDRMSNKQWSFRGDIRADNTESASKIKQAVQDSMNAVSALDRLIELGNTGWWESILPNEKSAIIIGVTNSIQAASRTEVAGSGAFSEQDAKRLDTIIPDLSTMTGATFRTSALGRLKEMRTRLTTKIQGIGNANGFQVVENSNTGLTQDQEAIARNAYQLAIKAGKSHEEAKAIALQAIKQ